MSLDLNKLRTSVKTRMSETAELARKLTSCFSSVGNFNEILSLIPQFETWANLCGDAVSFGLMMSWLEVQLVLGTRYTLHERAALQLLRTRTDLRDKTAQHVGSAIQRPEGRSLPLPRRAAGDAECLPPEHREVQRPQLGPSSDRTHLQREKQAVPGSTNHQE